MSDAVPAREFKLQLSKEWAEKLLEVDGAIEAIALEGLKRIVMKTPVDTGRARGNWAVSIGAIDTTTSETLDVTGGATITRGQAVIEGYTGRTNYPAIHIQNNLPYAEPLETGHSKQAPGGMVALTVAELQAMFNDKDI